MSSNRKQDQPQVFTIPPNFAREGTAFNGMIRTRNLVETALICVPLLYAMSYIPLSFQYKLILMILIVGPIGVISVLGINDSPISVFLLDAIKHLLSNKKLKYYLFGADVSLNDDNLQNN